MNSSEHAGHRERLRERMENEGLRSFAPHEVLELILTYAIPRGDVNPLAHRLIRHFGSLPAVLEASTAELCQVDGIGPRAASLLRMLLPVFQRYQVEKLMPRQQLETFSQLTAYCRAMLFSAAVEEFYVILLDARLHVQGTEKISTGTPMEVSIAPRLVAREAVRRNAVGVVIAHNHPSGSATPSQEDVDMTEQIRSALSCIDIRLYDHIIVGAFETFSFQQHGLLTEERGFTPACTEPAMAAERPQRKMPPRKK